jgi:hypothetical protein
MTEFQQFLKEYNPPGFVLLKNAQTKFVAQMGFQVSTFEDAKWSDSFDLLWQSIPTPKLLQTKEAKELAIWRFSEDEINDAHFTFDTLPESLVSEAADLKIFGESYTIFWIAEPDEEWVISAVLRQFQKHGDARIDGQRIRQVWNETVNRIFFVKREESDFDLHLLYEDMVENLIERINALPNAPLAEDWEILNEDPFGDEA